MGRYVMIKQDLYLHEYDWAVYIIYSVNQYDDIETLLNKYNCPQSLINKAVNNIFYKDTGFIYNDLENQISIIAVGEVSSSAQIFNTLIHECFHLVSTIKNQLNLNEEECALLIGELVTKIFNSFYQLFNEM